MGEQFQHLESNEKEHLIEKEEFEIRFAKFIVDPVAYMNWVRLDYLDENPEDAEEMAIDVINQMFGYLDYAEKTLPGVVTHPVLGEYFSEYDDEKEAHEESTRWLFSILKLAGFTYDELSAWVDYIPQGVQKEKHLAYREDRLILRDVYEGD